MQTAGLISKSKCASCRVRPAKKKEEPAEIKQPRAQPAERKKKLKKGIADKSISIPFDVLKYIVDELLKISPHHLLLLVMTNRTHRAFVMENHAIWRRFYIKWQGSFTESKYNSYVGSFFPNILDYHVPPPGRPSRFRWFESEVPQGKVAAFNAFAHKVMVLAHMRHCFFCGAKRGRLNTFWSLNLTACNHCTTDRLISDRVLLYKYGFDVSRPFGGRDSFFEACKLRAFFFVLSGGERTKSRFTIEAMDSPMVEPRTDVVMFWKPHVEKVMGLDFTALRREKLARDAAAEVLSSVTKRAYVHKMLRKLAVGDPANKVLLAMKHHENFHRTNTPIGMFYRVRQNYKAFLSARMLSDLLPEPWEKERGSVYAKLTDKDLPQYYSRYSA